jgi:integrase
MFSWAIAEGYIEDTPFKRGPVSVVKLETSVEGARTRRLEPSVVLPDGTTQDGEEARLLKHAGPQLRALILAALSTGCRLGELLSLQWRQIRRDEQGQARWIVLPAAKTKTAEARVIPVGPNLRSALELRRHAPDGTEHPSTAYVFGNEVGEPVKSIRTAWELTCDRAKLVICISTTCAASLRADCSNHMPICMTFSCSWDTQQSRRRADTCKARRFGLNVRSAVLRH